MAETRQRRHVIIGTAGHIDHGKTRLVAALTGIDTHRLPEEKRRGISIDLGFANWQTEEFVFGVVDVPGHKRFVRNMVAGATGIDIALLIIAADDSVMPQTLEHLQIMQWLGIQCGIVVLTKTDLVDREMCDLAEADIREITQNTFLQDAALIRVSSETGVGLQELRQAITTAADQHQRAPAMWPIFRMPIDRSFSLPGHGTVVTGSALCGTVAAGDRLDLLPDQQEVRVRSVQSHHQQADHAQAGQRTAINLAAVKPEDVPRGKELATNGWLQATRRLLVELQSVGQLLASKKRINVAVHLGTSEAPARLVMKSGDIEEGQNCVAELILKQPVVATHGQRFILRLVSPARTIGGGRILDPVWPSQMRLRETENAGHALASDQPRHRVSYIASLHTFLPGDLRSFAVRTGCSIRQVEDCLEELRSEGVLLQLLPRDRHTLIHIDRLEALCTTILRQVEQDIARHPPGRSRAQRLLMGACRDLADETALRALFSYLIARKKLIPIGPNLALPSSEHKLSKKQTQTLGDMLTQIKEQGLAPPTVKELTESLQQPAVTISQLLDIATEDGFVIRVDPQLHYSPEAIELARQQCQRYFRENQSGTLAQLRDLWQVTRKHAVPLCEYFDMSRVTQREGDLRVAGSEIDTVLCEAETNDGTNASG